MSRSWWISPVVIMVLATCTSCGTFSSKPPLEPVVTVNSDTDVTDVQFFPDGSSFLVVDLNRLTISKTDPTKPLIKTDKLVDGMDNGFAFACIDATADRIWVAKQEQGVACFDDAILDQKALTCPWSVSNFYHPVSKDDAITMIDETTLARVSQDKSEPVWKQKTRFESIEGTHAFSEKWIALAEYANQRTPVVHIYSLETGERLALEIAHKDTVRGIAFSNDEALIATASTDGEFKVFEISSGKPIWENKNDRDGAFGIAIHPDMDHIAVGCLNGIKVWSLKEKKLVASWNAHKRFVPTLKFSPDGSFLVSGSVDKSAKLWRMENVFGTMTYERPK